MFLFSSFQYTSMKSIGVKAVDDTFKVSLHEVAVILFYLIATFLCDPLVSKALCIS